MRSPHVPDSVAYPYNQKMEWFGTVRGQSSAYSGAVVAVPRHPGGFKPTAACVRNPTSSFQPSRTPLDR